MRKQPPSEHQFDPISGQELEADQVSLFCSQYQKRKYFFCSDRCRAAFEQHAQRVRINQMAKVGALLSPGRVTWGLA